MRNLNKSILHFVRLNREMRPDPLFRNEVDLGNVFPSPRYGSVGFTDRTLITCEAQTDANRGHRQTISTGELLDSNKLHGALSGTTVVQSGAKWKTDKHLVLIRMLCERRILKG